MSQKQTLLAALRKGPVTTWKATTELGIMRASERIRELAADGYRIEVDYPQVKTRHGKTKVARYWLIEEVAA